MALITRLSRLMRADLHAVHVADRGVAVLDAHLAAFPAEPSEAPPEGRVHWRRTPAGAAVRVVHRGAYAKLPETHAKLAAWLAVHGLEPGRASWEQYVSNPAETPPSERVTHVYALLAPGTEEPSPAGIESD